MVYLTVFFKKSSGEIIRTEKNKYVASRVALRRFLGVDDVSDIGVTYLEGVDELAGEGWRVVYPPHGGKAVVAKDGLNLSEEVAIEKAREYIRKNDVVHVQFEGGMGDYLLQCDALRHALREYPKKEFVCHVDPTRICLLEKVDLASCVKFVSGAVKEKEYVDMRKITGMDYFHPPAGKAYTYGVLLGFRHNIEFCRIVLPAHLVSWGMEERARILQGDGFLVALHWQSGQPANAKSWFWERVEQFTERIGEEGGKVVVLGGYGEKVETKVKGLFQRQGVLSWEQVSAMVGVSDVVVAIDSAIMHIALRMSKPIVSLWGPTSSEWILPHFAKHVPIEGACSKRPCGRYNCPGRECMGKIDVDSVIKSVLLVISGQSGILWDKY